MLSDGHHLVVFSPHGVLPGCEVAGGLAVGPEYGEFGLPCLFAGFPDHPCLWGVEQGLAPVFEFSGAQGFALLVYPPAEGEVLGDADFDLGVVGDGVQAGDVVLGPPADEGLVALQPHQGFGPVDAGAQERGDRGRVPGRGEVEQGRFRGGVGVVLLALTVTSAAGADDPPLLVPPDMNLALAARQSPGGELLDEALIVTARALEDGDQSGIRGGGDHVFGVLVRLQEDGHDDAGHLGGAVAVEPEGPADVLDDLDLGAAGVGEADRLHAAFAGDVDAFAEYADGGEERAVYAPVVRVDAVGELAQDLAPLRDVVVAAQPCRPDPVWWDVAAGLQLVELGLDRRRGELLRGGQVGVGGIGGVQLGGRLGQLLRERGCLLDLLVEGHDRTQVPCNARIPADFRLYLTATPRILAAGRPQQGTGDQELEIASMANDPDGTYGAWIAELGLSEAIERGILAGFEIDVLEIHDPSPVHRESEEAQRGRRLALLQDLGAQGQTAPSPGPAFAGPGLGGWRRKIWAGERSGPAPKGA